MTRTAYLVRHGHCEGAGTLLGHVDTPLTQEGLEQAHELAEHFAGLRIDAIVSSDLLRARQTADVIAGRLGLPVQFDSRLREISYGDWDGKTWAEIEAASGDIARFDSAWPEFAARVSEAWEAIRALPADRVVVVTHAAVIAALRGGPPGLRPPQYASITMVPIQ